ncbi:MAG TPA: hypothetical protein VKA38_14555 [Draconibacterium sp.]|nr:hypothetical protein [Draconibacterium sp.]
MKSGMDESHRPGYEVHFTGKTILPYELRGSHTVFEKLGIKYPNLLDYP